MNGAEVGSTKMLPNPHPKILPRKMSYKLPG